MKVKNYQELSEKVYEAVEQNLHNLKEVIVGDTYSPTSNSYRVRYK